MWKYWISSTISALRRWKPLCLKHTDVIQLILNLGIYPFNLSGLKGEIGAERNVSLKQAPHMSAVMETLL